MLTKEACTKGCGFPEESRREGLRMPGKRLQRHPGEGLKGELERNRKEKEGKDRADRDHSKLCQRGSHSCLSKTLPYYLNH